MREIKFRFWDGSNMYELGHLADIAYRTDFAEAWGDDLTTYKIMQYTGLKDKNGVEIYEGDLMRYLARYPKDYQESQPHKRFGRINNGVSWSDRWCCFLADSTYEKENVFLGFDENKQWEVIGNIYENPELLTEKKRWKLNYDSMTTKAGLTP